MKKKKKNLLTLLALFILTIIPTITAFASLNSNTIGLKRNFVESDGTKTYEITANLDGGKFNSGTTPEFTQKDTNNWVHNYKPIATEITLPTPIKNGYEFIGWSSDENPNINKTFVIPKWNNKNINIKANWKSSNATLITGPTFNSTISNMPNFANVTEIRFVKETPNPNGINVAIEGDAKAYIEGNVLKIACDSKIYANTNSSEMFRDFGNTTNKILKKITFENFNTTNVKYMSYMFYNCSSLTNLDVNNFNTNNVIDMSDMFSNCSSLTNLDLSNFNTTNVKYMGYMFNDCSSLTSLDLSNFNTSNVKYMNFMFSNCKKLTNLDLSNFNTTNVTNMNYMFKNCSSLTSLDLSNFNTTNVTDMNSMFYYCSSLTSLDLSNFNTTNVTNMKSMFKNCSSLTSLDLSNFNTTNVIDMNDMFRYCNSLTILNLSNFNTSNVKDMSCMFNDCKKLSGNITISNPNTKYYSYMFKNCSTDLSAKFIVKYKDAATKETAQNMVNTKNPEDHVYLYEPISVKYKFNISDGSTIPTEIKNLLPIDNNTYLIYENNKVTIKNPSKKSITIGNNKYTFQSYDKTNGFTITNNMLKTDSNGNKYIEITGTWKKEQTLNGDYLLPGYEFNQKVTKIKGMANAHTIRFVKTSTTPRGTIDLSEKQNGSITTSGVSNGILTIESNKTIYANPDSGQLFAGRNNYPFDENNFVHIRNIELTNFDTSHVTNMTAMFRECKALESIDVSKFNTSNVTSMSSLFAGCNVIRNINVSNFNTSKVTDMSSMFHSCNNITRLDLSNFDTRNVTDMAMMFLECSKLQSVNLSSFRTPKLTDLNGTFELCSSLRTLDLSTFDISNVDDMQSTFDSCSNLRTLNLGECDTSGLRTAYGLFHGCTNLTTTFTIRFDSIENMFNDTASNSGCVTVNYGRAYYESATRNIKKKGPYDNVVLGKAV